MRLSFFPLVHSPRCYSPPSPLPFFLLPPEEKLSGAARCFRYHGDDDDDRIEGEKVPVLLGGSPKGTADTQYIIPNSRYLRDIREVLIKMLDSWQYPHRVTSLRNSETGAACVLTSTLTAGTRFPFQRERVRIRFFSSLSLLSQFPKSPTYRHRSHVNFHYNEKIPADDCWNIEIIIKLRTLGFPQEFATEKSLRATASLNIHLSRYRRSISVSSKFEIIREYYEQTIPIYIL